MMENKSGSLDLNCKRVKNQPFGVVLHPQNDGQKVMTLSVNRLRTLARSHHLVVLRGFTSDFADAEVLAEYAKMWGEIMMWPFGAVLNVIEDQHATDHIFDNSYVPLHWDGMYKSTIPEFQLFHCAAAPAANEGGRTTFVDTSLMIANASEQVLAQWKAVSVTYRIAQVVHYGGTLCSPLLVKHPTGKGMIMRYNEPPVEGKKFLNQHTLEYHGIAPEQQAEFRRVLHKSLYDVRHFYAHHWQKGDVVIADNFSLLHGREGFTHCSTRHLQRVHIQSSPPCINQALKL